MSPPFHGGTRLKSRKPRGLGPLGAALFSIGIPHHSVLQYEQALKADAFIVLAHGASAEIERAKTMLQFGAPTQLDLHADAKPSASLAA